MDVCFMCGLQDGVQVEDCEMSCIVAYIEVRSNFQPMHHIKLPFTSNRDPSYLPTYNTVHNFKYPQLPTTTSQGPSPALPSPSLHDTHTRPHPPPTYPPPTLLPPMYMSISTTPSLRGAPRQDPKSVSPRYRQQDTSLLHPHPA